MTTIGVRIQLAPGEQLHDLAGPVMEWLLDAEQEHADVNSPAVATDSTAGFLDVQLSVDAYPISACEYRATELTSAAVHAALDAAADKSWADDARRSWRGQPDTVTEQMV